MDFSNLIQGVVGQQLTAGIADKLGIKNAQAKTAIAMAVPLLLSALNKNSNKNATGIANALEKDHDGSILDNIAGFLGQGNTQAGEGILGHVLGGKQNSVAEMIGKAAGIESNQSGDLLKMIAPVVMGALGKEKASQGLDANGVSDLLTNVMGNMKQQGGEEVSMVEKMLDQDGDGSMMDDVMNIGSKLFGNFFNKK